MADPLGIAFLLFPTVSQLDPTAASQVLPRLGYAKLDLVWKSREPVMPTQASRSCSTSSVRSSTASLPTGSTSRTPRLTIYAEGQNLSDAGRRELTGPGRAYLQESAEYGRTFFAGVTANF